MVLIVALDVESGKWQSFDKFSPNGNITKENRSP